ncbi:NnrS family protein (plasmid) [Thalassobaculum sp. OXR-137]|uniref:NnrS family protein n=1 Tax=Thalassobaculum sp. OXR-137 TaxID=3100173 RepID=UPI002AC9ACAE|nr:NnrS family protein [Thalassobaculum sp. OXR-137]WPZ37195.1 NnrS family protein [Thalassobaculum sp. OXR-137]
MSDDAGSGGGGLAFLSLGFRPFFLLAALWAATAVALWICLYEGRIALPGPTDPLTWHIHELMFGYLWAVLAGFLLTALPSWTKRPPIVGTPLALLVGLWILGRGAMLLPGLSLLQAGGMALLFPVVFAAVALREIGGGGNRRNLPVGLAIVALILAEIGFLLESSSVGYPSYAPRVAIAVMVMLVALIGGRVTPNFTTNWLKRNESGAEPAPFGVLDRLVLLAGALALVLWVLLPGAAPWLERTAGVALALAGFGHLVRQARWSPFAVRREPLLAVLHLGYLFVPLGFLLGATAVFRPGWIDAATALHAWTVGAFGLMPIAIMVRATRGHTGRPLTAPPATVIVFGAILTATLLRLGAGAGLIDPHLGLRLAGLCWSLGFLGFVGLYARTLIGKSAPATP